MTKRVWKAEVRGNRLRGRPKFAWLDGVKGALEERDVGLEDARVFARDRNEWRRIVRGE